MLEQISHCLSRRGKERESESKPDILQTQTSIPNVPPFIQQRMVYM